MFNHILLEGKIMRILSKVGIAVKQGSPLLLEVLLQIGIGLAACMVQCPDVAFSDKHRVLFSSAFLRETIAVQLSVLVHLEKILAVGRGLYFDDVDFIIILVKNIHIATVGMAVLDIFKEFLLVDIFRICDKRSLEISLRHLQGLIFNLIVIRKKGFKLLAWFRIELFFIFSPF